jgi:hypothetical protein
MSTIRKTFSRRPHCAIEPRKKSLMTAPSPPADWWNGTIEDYARSNSLAITVDTNWLMR